MFSYTIVGDKIVKHGENYAAGKKLDRKPKPGMASLWLARHRVKKYTSVDWYASKEELEKMLDANGLQEEYEAVEYPISCLDDDIFFGKFVGKGPEDAHEQFQYWTDVTLQVPVADIPAGTHLDQVQLDVTTGSLYFYEKNGVLLAREDMTFT